MKIAIDIDEVLFEFVRGYLQVAKDKGYKELTFEEVYTYNLWEPLGVSKEEAVQISEDYHNSNFFNSPEVVLGAKEALKKLNNYELFFITNRPLRWKLKTLSFLKENFGVDSSHVYFAGDFHKGNGKGKAEICKELGVSLIVEDHSEFVEGYANEGITVLLLDKPWNKNVLHENIIRCKDWNEVLRNLEGFKSGN